MSECHDGPLVVFRSIPDFWRIERNGNKPNTLRILSQSEYPRIDAARAALMMGEPASIDMMNTETGEEFFRRITDISQVGSMLGSDIWVISWRHEDGVGTYRDPDDDEEGADDAE